MSFLPFLAHGVTLTFAWFLVINLAACVAVAAAIRFVGRQRINAPAFWFAARLFPAATAAAFVVLLFIPSYWRYEPRQFVEGFDLTLTAMAAVSVALVAFGVARGVAAWRSAARRAADWMSHARPIALAGSTLPAYAIDASQPMIALVGVLRPRLLVTRGLINSLTPPELAASVAHEAGHHRALDNLKRLLMRATPDLITRSAAREIEKQWAAAAERAADRAATGTDAATRCTLASALVKVARLTPAAVPASEPISLLLTDGDIASRIHVLLNDATPARPQASALGWAAAGTTVLALAAAYTPILQAVHDATELLVHSLP